MAQEAPQDGAVGGATLPFASDGVSKDSYWKAIAAWQTQLPALVDGGATAIYIMTPKSFSIAPLAAPWKSEAELDALLQPFTKNLTELNINYSRDLSSEAIFLDHYDRYFGPPHYGGYPAAQLLDGRLIARFFIEQNNDGLTAVLCDITEDSSFYVAAPALSVNNRANKTQPISSTPSSKHGATHS